MLLKVSVISKTVLILLYLSQFFKVNHLFSHIYRVGGVFIKSLVDQIINNAYESMASDIHITSSVNEGVVRFRVKGTMINYRVLNLETFKRLINYLKFIAELDINEHKIPQSGRTKFKINERTLNLRISTLPLSLLRECVVIRLLNLNVSKELTDLFYKEDDYDILRSYMDKGQGLILFTGPTGSGKSTVMYKLAEEVANKGQRSIISIEDPVEYEVDGLVQVEINEKANLKYAPLVRGVLRCDPDIIMFGEIRDKEIASELIKTSLSGHLVLSTFHSKSALSTLVRLKEYDLYKEEMIEAISLIVNQRLIHTRDNSFIVYEYIEKEEIEKFLNDQAVNYTSVKDKLKIVYQEEGMSDEEYEYYNRIIE